MFSLNDVCSFCKVEADYCDYSEKNGFIWQCECCMSLVCTKCLEVAFNKCISVIADEGIICPSCKTSLE